MNDAHGLTKENLLSSFPASLQKNPSIAALGDAAAEALAKRPGEIHGLSIYPRTGELPEALLDILAYDFKVDWWDPNFTLEEKRRTFQDSWYVHRHLGTKAAVETAIRDIYPLTQVEEWFEYGGKPYHFRIRIDLTDTFGDETRPWRVLQMVDFYKSLRSHNDEIQFTMTGAPSTLYTGGDAGADASVGVPEGKDAFDPREQPLYAGGTPSSRTSLPVPEETAPPSSATILRVGGVCTILSNP